MQKNPSENGVLISGVGTDIISIDRIARAIARHGARFINHVFTLKEQAYCQKHHHPLPHYAGRFAAKEAIIKAFGGSFPTPLRWQDMEVVNDSKGKPNLVLAHHVHARFPNIRCLLSISHCEAYATAVAIITGEMHGTS